jgi:hypothetical protein
LKVGSGRQHTFHGAVLDYVQTGALKKITQYPDLLFAEVVVRLAGKVRRVYKWTISHPFDGMGQIDPARSLRSLRRGGRP